MSEPHLCESLKGIDPQTGKLARAYDIDNLAAMDDAMLLEFFELVIVFRKLTPEAKRLIRARRQAELYYLNLLDGERESDRAVNA